MIFFSGCCALCQFSDRRRRASNGSDAAPKLPTDLSGGDSSPESSSRIARRRQRRRRSRATYRYEVVYRREEFCHEEDYLDRRYRGVAPAQVVATPVLPPLKASLAVVATLPSTASDYGRLSDYGQIDNSAPWAHLARSHHHLRQHQRSAAEAHPYTRCKILPICGGSCHTMSTLNEPSLRLISPRGGFYWLPLQAFAFSLLMVLAAHPSALLWPAPCWNVSRHFLCVEASNLWLIVHLNSLCVWLLSTCIEHWWGRTTNWYDTHFLLN